MDDDGIMRIGNAADNEEVVALGRLAEHVGRFAAFSPDGTRIALPDGKRRIRIADTTNGQTALTIQLPEAQSGASATDTTEIAALMYAPNGQSLAVADAEGAISVWKAATGERLAGPEIPPLGQDRTAHPRSPRGRRWRLGTFRSLLESRTTARP